MSDASANRERLRFLEGVVTREAAYLTQTDRRLFSGEFGSPDVASWPHEPIWRPKKHFDCRVRLHSCDRSTEEHI